MNNHYTTKLCLLLVLFFSFLSTFKAISQVSVTATAGTTGPTVYTTLKGAFDAVNAGTHQGSVTINITGNTTETAAAILNASGSGSASYTAVSVKPGTGATPTVSGNLPSNALIRLNRSSNVTIDGSNNGTTTRDLTFTNTSNISGNVMLIGSTGTTPINNVTVKNCMLINGTNSSTAVIVGDAAVAGNPGYFSNITIQNNDIQKTYIGLYLYAVASALGNNTTVTGNSLNSTGANAIRMVGIYAQGVDGLVVSNNTIGNFETVNPEFDRAIWFATATKNASISGNTISGFAYTGTSSYAPIGINVSTGNPNSNITVTNNTVNNFTSSGTGTTMGMFIYSAMSGMTVSRNKVSNIKNTNTGGYGAAGILLTPTTTTSAIKVHNNFIWDVAGYGFNGYTSEDNGNGIVVDGGGGIDINFNSVVLNTEQTLTGGHRASCLLISSYVSASGTIDVRNNILANLQTVGNGNSRLVLSNLASSGNAVFGTINHNDYYSTSGNLSSTGTNASITTTLAQLQTNLGGNGSSMNVQPMFIGTNDLHMNPNFTTLSNDGTPIAGIATDIDGNTRNGITPDMGADEFAPCATITFTTPPVATSVCEGSDTGFSVVATNATIYQWQVNTGSGFTDITNNAIYSGATTANLHLTGVPLSYNTYTYRCKATSIAACNFTNSTAAMLTVNARPDVSITPANPAFCPGGSVTLNAPTPGYTYQWFQGGSPIAPAATGATYSANAIGSYSVKVTSTTTGCKDTSNPVTVTANPVITATQNLTICTNQLPYTWNSQTIAAAGVAVATFTTPSLVTGCDSITTLNLATTATVSAIQNLSICANQLPYNWNGNTITSGGNAVSTFTSTSASGCDSTTTLNLTVNPLLTGIANLTICQNQLPYTWNSIVVNSGGAAVATYTTPSLVNGCDSTTTLNLTVNPNPTVTATPMPLSICSGSATSIALSSPTTGSNIAWTVTQTGATGASAGTGASIIQTLTASGTVPGKVIYTITATANGCASNPVRDTVTVNPLPATTATPSSQTICSGAATSIDLTSPVSGATFSWTVTQSNVTGASANNSNNITQTLTATTSVAGTATYTVKANANSCNGPNTIVTVNVTPIPATPGTITGSDAPCIGSTQTYSVVAVPGATSYTWGLPVGWTGSSTTNSITVTVGSNSGTINVLAGNSCGTSSASNKSVTAVPIVTPTVSITSNAPAPLCSGTFVTFTASATNGGALPTYGWKVNNNSVGNNSNTYTYQPNDGDTISCTLTSNAACLTVNPANSNTIIMNVTPSVTTALNIYVPENHVCNDELVHFIATPTNGGTAPAYQWKINNINTGTNSTSLNFVPANGDVVTCWMTSNEACATPASTLSNTVLMTVTPVTHPTVSITTNPASGIVNGQPVTFTANPVQAGSNYQVAWYKNGTYMSAITGNSWTGVAGTDFMNNTRIQARLQSFSTCARPDTAWSNTIKMSVGTTGIGNTALPDGFKVYPNPTNNIVNIEGLKAGDELTVYDVTGHRLIHQQIRHGDINRVDLSSFAQGIYRIRFVNTKSQQWQVSLTKQ
jgi:hypothetical protein